MRLQNLSKRFVNSSSGDIDFYLSIDFILNVKPFSMQEFSKALKELKSKHQQTKMKFRTEKYKRNRLDLHRNVFN